MCTAFLKNLDPKVPPYRSHIYIYTVYVYIVCVCAVGCPLSLFKIKEHRERERERDVRAVDRYIGRDRKETVYIGEKEKETSRL